ncbi:MAG: nucleotide pyrophosphohydrolase [Candidatus Saccharimonadales bacterium]
MSLADYQKQIDDELQQYELPYWCALSILARLTEEVGEVARVVNHLHGDKPPKPGESVGDLAGELADVLYSVICLANSQGISLDEPLQKSIAKLATRDKGRFKKK